MKTYLPLFIYLSFKLTSQNLVPNPSFELFTKLPVKTDNSIVKAKDWIPPKFGSDYYHQSASKAVGTPKNHFGRQEPHSGYAYAGICTRTKFLEYLEAKLIEPLKKDQEYLVELYICKAERSIGSIKEFGILFSSKKIWGITNKGISVKPQIIFSNPKGYKNKKDWVKLSAIYKATGDEVVLTFGHFNYDPSDDKRKIICHYYVDDISVTPINKKDTVEKVIIQETNTPDKTEFEFGKKIVLNNIYFKTNESELLPSSNTELDKLSKYLIDTPNTTIEISGHTDNTGNEPQNKFLSEDRAKAVTDYLKSKGINESRITYVGKGSSVPISNNDTDEGRQKNRRVEFIISQK
ncbi:MAG: OmpA family protein [Bacteroidia bacterium]|nr:OmpA family protein [Bacteroidia bacterium]